MTRSVSSGSNLGQADWSEFAGGFRYPLRTILSFEFALALLLSVGAWKKIPLLLGCSRLMPRWS